MIRSRHRRALVCFATFFALSSVSNAQDKKSGSAHAEMRNQKGELLGTINLTEGGAGVRLRGRLKGLPAGVHGIHVHQVGKCEAPDFKTSGDHLNPTSKQHGDLNPGGPHAGDLGNVTVGSNGSLSLDQVAKGVTLSAGPNSLMHPGGTSLMIHAKEDDRKTDPSGNSGERIACGVITQ